MTLNDLYGTVIPVEKRKYVYVIGNVMIYDDGALLLTGLIDASGNVHSTTPGYPGKLAIKALLASVPSPMPGQ